MLKTLAVKYRTKVSKIKKRYERNGDIIVPFQTNSGEKEITFYNQGFRKQKWASNQVEDIPVTFGQYGYEKEVIRRYKNKYCELCGKHDMNIEIHQIAKMSSLTGKWQWEKVMMKI